MSEQTLTIGKLARVSGVHIETIRYYQRRGLLRTPPRPPGGIRRYGEKDARRLAFIRHAQQLGFSLEEVAQLMRLDDGTHCEDARELAAGKLADVRRKIEGLRQIEALLETLVERCETEGGNLCCPLIDALYVLPGQAPTSPPKT
ncbi:Hg(II)-responsive transcriptional regulator [Hahella sp. SMD15-11]|uniref:Mercuric resistance operon regulatory protein n=1 Tax=Thermohahella caldifontis TaxID=3142973 RepID=A0AB39UWA8_9GAMM